ncbi:MAG TPA: lysophospholipid acyltransferase family protein [Candidatus Binatia bacterium]|nr:lysophospholipid acyltransferase family protein [Candidatus Binatia bacterium]
MSTDRSAEAALGSDAAAFVSGLRVALSPHLFRGMLVAMAAVAVAVHRTTGNRDLAWRFAKARARTLAWLLGVQVTMRGRENIAGGGPFVFTPNHQSHLDILLLLGHLPGRTRFAAKRELWSHPVVGAVLDTLGMVPIERDQPEHAIQALNRAGAERDSVVIFPEGTRSRTGQLLPFKKGAFVLAIASGLPIVPVVCRGTRRLMPRGSQLSVLPGEAEIVIEAPIPTAGLSYDDRDALAARVRAVIEQHHTGW